MGVGRSCQGSRDGRLLPTFLLAPSGACSPWWCRTTCLPGLGLCHCKAVPLCVPVCILVLSLQGLQPYQRRWRPPGYNPTFLGDVFS